MEDLGFSKEVKAAILARTAANVDVDAIKLHTYYCEKIKKLEGVNDKKADELDFEWKAIFKGFVLRKLLQMQLSEEELDSAISYLKEKSEEWEFKLYLVNCCSNYNNGDCIEYGSYDVGIYSTIDLAKQAGQNELKKNYKWDEELQKYYGSYSDEAWIEIRECSIDKPIDFNGTAIEYIPKKEVE